MICTACIVNQAVLTFFCFCAYQSIYMLINNCIFAPWRPSRMAKKLPGQMVTIPSTFRIRSWKQVMRLRTTTLMFKIPRGMLRREKTPLTPNLKCPFLSLNWFYAGDLLLWFQFLRWPQALLSILLSLHRTPQLWSGQTLPWAGPMTRLLHLWLRWKWLQTSELFLTLNVET